MASGTKTTFDRAPSERFLEALEKASESGWWRDVMNDPKLVVAFRGSYLNVYYKGQSIFKIRPDRRNELLASTHEKYLLDPDLSGLISFNGGEFDIENLRQRAFLKHYEGKSSLDRIKRAAKVYAGHEKIGCHALAVRTPNLLDVEIALPGDIELDEPGLTVTTPRIDLLTIEPEEAEKARLVFWEAKAFRNPDLGSARSSRSAPVLAQIALYRDVLADYGKELVDSYAAYCEALRRIRARAGREVHHLIEDVATGKRKLTLGDIPQVNLVVFGYDTPQREAWQGHRAMLKEELRAYGARLYTIGDASNGQLPMA